MRRLAVLVTGLLFVSTAAARQAPIAGAAGLTDTVGALRIGQPFRIPPQDLRWRLADWPDPTSCTQVAGGSLPEGVGMMVYDERIARFEIPSFSGAMVVPLQPPTGPFGLRVGMRMVEALVRLPSGTSIEPHKYNWPGGHYLTWHDVLRSRAIRVEVADGVFVDSILWGTDAVQLTEGCV